METCQQQFVFPKPSSLNSARTRKDLETTPVASAKSHENNSTIAAIAAIVMQGYRISVQSKIPLSFSTRTQPATLFFC